MISGGASATANTTTAITLPGTGGAADADLYIQVQGHSDLSLEVSSDGTNFSSNQGNTNINGQPVMIASGEKVRIRNSNAVTARYFTYTCRYTGSPS